MTWVSVAIGVAGVATSAYGAYSQKKAADKAGKASDPFGRYRRYYGDMLQGFMEDPSKWLEDPIFTSAEGRGLQAVQRKMASSGHTTSGNMATALLDYSRSFALDYLTNQEQFLAMLAGAPTVPNAMPASLQAGAGAWDSLGNAMFQLGGVVQNWPKGGSTPSNSFSFGQPGPWSTNYNFPAGSPIGP